GTSMATPHTTGSGALMMGLHTDWSPQEAKSALMMTALEAGLTKADGSTPSDFFDRGSGRLQDFPASKAGLVLNETGLNFTAGHRCCAVVAEHHHPAAEDDEDGNPDRYQHGRPDVECHQHQ